MCTEIYPLVQRAPKQLPRSLQRLQKASTQNQKSKCDKPIFTQRLGDFKERIFRQRDRGVRYAEVSCRSHACTADTIKDRGFWKCISELKKVMPWQGGGIT